MSLSKKLLSNKPIQRDIGLLIIRIGIGLTVMTLHGYGKIKGGPGLWDNLGGAMSQFGITFAPKFWGFMAAFSEFGGSALLILGLFFRPAAGLLAFTMLIAVLRHLSIPAGEQGAGWSGASHAMELLVVYLGLLFAGSGRYAIGTLFNKKD